MSSTYSECLNALKQEVTSQRAITSKKSNFSHFKKLKFLLQNPLEGPFSQRIVLKFLKLTEKLLRKWSLEIFFKIELEYKSFSPRTLLFKPKIA